MTSTDSLGYEMEASANDGDCPRLQAQLAQWESQHMGSSISLEERLGFKPCQAEIEEVHQALDLPFPPGSDREPEKNRPHLLRAQSVDDPGCEEGSGKCYPVST